MSQAAMFVAMRVSVMAWLLIAAAIFASNYRRRKKFPLRAALSAFVCIGTAVLLGWGCYELLVFLHGAGAATETVYPLINLCSHLLMYALCIAALWVCFDEKPATIVFGSIAAYAIQNIANLLTAVCGAIWPATKFISTNPVTLLSFGVWFACYAGTYALIYLIFARNIRRIVDISSVNTRSTLILFIVIVTVAIAARSVGAVYTDESTPLFVILAICNICCCITVLFAQFLIGQNVDAIRENEAIRAMSEAKLRQYEFSRENMEILNEKLHDMKHQLLKIKEGNHADSEYIDRLAQSVSMYDAAIRTGYTPLDVVLTDKSVYCAQNGIQLSVIADGEKLSFMQVSDIYSLFGNAMDNAAEYLLTLPPEERVIRITVTTAGNLVCICIRNRFDGPCPRFVNGLPQSTKPKDGYHGYGLKSMRRICEKYGGSFSVSAKDSMFTVSLLLPRESPN